jgi:hypothetical protein
MGRYGESSFANVYREISAIAPAISTPVGPPPMITNVIACLALLRLLFFRQIRTLKESAA